MKPTQLSQFFIPSKAQQTLALPGIFLAILANLIMVSGTLFGGITEYSDWVSLAVGFGFLLYLGIFYVYLIPLMERHPQRSWVLVTVNILLGVIIKFYAPLLPAGFSLLCVLLMITISAVALGRWRTYIFLSSATFAHITAISLQSQGIDQSIFYNLFLMPLGGIAITETILRLQESLQIEIRRQQILNKVSHSLSSSLEMHQVITMVTTAIQGALDADTYYFGLLQGDSIHLELFYDDGEFFPSTDVPLEGTLAGRVISSRQPILIQDLPEERKKLNISFKLVGKPRISRSWMGVPLEAGGKKMGIIAVASYQKAMFNQKDLDLLVNIGQQAALA
ncbi:MAG: GAF domain-containing protein, partial [Chloroflexota bacterium]